MPKYYTGVGSRKTPQNVCELMSAVARKMAQDGWVLRSGGALGADSAFYSGVPVPPRGKTISHFIEVYRPQGDSGYSLINVNYIGNYPYSLWDTALNLAASVHPAWERCSDYAKGLHARNCFQVLGRNLDNPSAGLICWTPDGAISEQECSIRTGGTGTAIKLADRYNIPIRNLSREDHLQAAIDWLNQGE